MIVTRLVGLSALLVASALLLGLAPQEKPAPPKAPTASPAGAETFLVDPVHSSNVFKIRHFGVSNFYGRFDKVSGKVVWNPSDPAAGSIAVTVKTDSIDTNNDGRNKHLKSADFFEVDKFATIEFKSTGIKKSGEHTFDVTGDLLLHGVTKPITVTFTYGGVADTRMGRRTGLETTFTIKRSEYGMTKFIEGGMLGDEVTMTLSLECVVEQKSEGE